MQLRMVKPADLEFDEKEIQHAFEQDLDTIEEGLRLVGSFIPIGTGIIDSLALDEDDNPVFIEYKRPGAFDKDALLQLMEYYSWFATDQNHILNLKNIVQKKYPDVEPTQDIRLIAVVSNVEERVKNACWALDPSIKLVTYSGFKHADGSFGIVPKVLLDTTEGTERLIAAPKTEEDHLAKHQDFRQLYNEIKKKISSVGNDIKFNPTPQDYIAAARRKVFCTIHFKKRWIRLDLNTFPSEANNTNRYYPSWKSDWGYVHVSSLQDLDEELLNWLKIAYNRAL